MAETDAPKPTCFIAMPITTHEAEAERYGGDTDHWAHVMETIFVKAVEAAGFEPIRPIAKGSDLIHGTIIKHLSTADMVLCDLSSHNPNVFFELGVRTSLNLPIALVIDGLTSIPFDTSGINTHTYSPTLHGWEVETEITRLMKHIQDSVDASAGGNPLWKHFGLTIAARKPEATGSADEAKLELIFEGMMDLRRQLSTLGTNSPTITPRLWKELRLRDEEAAADIAESLGSAHSSATRSNDGALVQFTWDAPSGGLGFKQDNGIRAALAMRDYDVGTLEIIGDRLRVRARDLAYPE